MNLCKTCGMMCPFCDEHEECDAYSPLTNFQRITASPEALAEFIAEDREWCHHAICIDCDGCTKEGVLKWLKQESE